MTDNQEQEKTKVKKRSNTFKPFLTYIGEGIGVALIILAVAYGCAKCSGYSDDVLIEKEKTRQLELKLKLKGIPLEDKTNK